LPKVKEVIMTKVINKEG